ncbi:lytic murein transglycosylase [Shewanella sp. NIFS-20-20]|uniref:lytic murein transglycosylase n=1 Tax=Shewanella sp. NIFS-20-20 TaxID=2853806 RepID=UPI001C47A9C6|nr:lytic murein transglycosylase [Shewanella sp. NIFS-20-20]MBV7314421.1 lytic murein transglycosylase [Shewanella sp. NIFS-20-20]
MNKVFYTSVLLVSMVNLVLPPVQANMQRQERSFAEQMMTLKAAVLADPRQPYDAAALNMLLSDVKPYLRQTLEVDPSLPINLDTYLPLHIPNDKVERAISLQKQHERVLTDIAKQYQVQARFILAVWGIASDYGADMGSFPALTVLATQSLQADLDTTDFVDAIVALAASGLTPRQFTANRDGRLGQAGLTASQYLQFGADGDGDDKIDIWHNHADVFATIANMLRQQGWQMEATWGRQVQVPDDFVLDNALAKGPQAFEFWQGLGVRRFNGDDLPKVASIRANLIAPDGINGRKYLVYENYRALNQLLDNHYASISVTYLSERIKYPKQK